MFYFTLPTDLKSKGMDFYTLQSKLERSKDKSCP